jgi:hypothetical protein
MAADPSVQYLSIMAVVFSSLSALFGVYLVLFILTVWSTYRSNDRYQTRLRIITIVLFVILCIHYINRALSLWRSRVLPTPSDQFLHWTIPTTFIGGISTTLSGFVSDGLLAWRFYVIFDRHRWALYIPATAIVANALLGLSGDIQHLLVYQHTTLYQTHLRLITFEITAAWGWVMFVINTFLTGSILCRIMYIARSGSRATAVPFRHSAYGTATEAIIESALVTWFGILLYEITTFAPHGRVTSNLDVSFVMVCVLPIFFGISQCLITARLALATQPHPPSTIVNIRHPTGSLGSGTSVTGDTIRHEASSSKLGNEVEVDIIHLEKSSV